MSETITERIKRKLDSALSPTRLDIIDESENHRGHGGYRDGGETHFRIEVVSPVFAGMSRVARERRVHEVLADEIADRVHALSLALKER